MIGNLYQAVMDASKEDHDHRFQAWVRRIDKVDASQANGYAFRGDFVNDGTVEYKPESGLYLVKTVTGSRKYQHSTYTVVEMGANGGLEATDIQTTDNKRGWALRIRDDVAELLAGMGNDETPVTVTLTGEAARLFRKAQSETKVLTDEEILNAALGLYDARLGGPGHHASQDEQMAAMSAISAERQSMRACPGCGRTMETDGGRSTPYCENCEGRKESK